jgi:hypothetical protein
MARYALVAPFVAAILLYAVAPLLTMQAKAIVRYAIAAGRQHVSEVREGDIPYYLAAESIYDYIEFTADVVQVFPVFLLPIVGAVYTFSSAVPTPVSVTLLFVAIVLAIGVSAWVTSVTPADYVSRKWHGYPLVPLIGIAFNIIALALVLAFS